MSRGQKRRTVENFPKMNDRRGRRIVRRWLRRASNLDKAIRQVNAAFEKMGDAFINFTKSLSIIETFNYTHYNELKAFGTTMSASRAIYE